MGCDWLVTMTRLQTCLPDVDNHCSWHVVGHAEVLYLSVLFLCEIYHVLSHHPLES